ncbi:MAG TPA: hypothetical protein VGS08_01495 [Candidatus Saccharimonadales bacterium]|nr:hypothetical protein [Candidatus Saccharimonadales bacterium]
MATDIKTIKLYIEEQRRYHDELTLANITARAKIITYTGAVLALLAFLYVGALDSRKTVAQKLFIPQQLYGKLFYYFGLFAVLYALGKLIHGSRPSGIWTVAVESKDVSTVETMSEESYLIKLKNDYEVARKSNIQQYDRRQTALGDSFYPMLMGAIILIVLRYFQ